MTLRGAVREWLLDGDTEFAYEMCSSDAVVRKAVWSRVIRTPEELERVMTSRHPERARELANVDWALVHEKMTLSQT